MSAGILIMNKNAIAMAADSAVTIGDHVAIHNSANKLFSLSKVSPVGMIIYSNASFMEIPVEIIVKQYKEHLGKKSFATLNGYVDDFILYLKNNSSLFRFSINEKRYVEEVLINLLGGLKNGYNSFTEEKIKSVGRELNDDEKEEIREKALKQTLTFIEAQPKISSSKHSDYIKAIYRSDFEKIITDICDWLDPPQVNCLLEKAYTLYDTEFERNGYVGMAIAGYGDDEIFPHMIHLHLDGIIDGEIKYRFIEKVEINEDNIASIVPLAQTDVMQTFLFGINDQFLNDLAQELPKEINESVSSIDDSFFAEGKKKDVQTNLIGVTNKIIKHVSETARDSYMFPIIQSVATLPIEELALLAESMINITSVRRKVAIDRNIGTVGGPIDVAIVSKGDGFIWLKRKHYFERKYNPQFFYSHYDNNGSDNDDE